MRRLTRRQQLSAISLTLIALIFISLDFTGGSLRGARTGTTGALGSLYRGTDGVLGPVRRFVQGIPDVGTNRAKIAQLQAANDALARKLTESQVDQATAQQLKALQLQANSTTWSILPARVIATGPGSGFQWTVTIDVGAGAHVLVGQTVTNGVGVVGRVLSVQANTSVVLLISDPTAALGVRDGRSGALMLGTGAGSDGLTATSFAAGSDVKVGDEMLTGPVGGTTFAPNLSVGIVKSVATATDGTVTVGLRASAAQTGLNLLGVISLPTSGADRPLINPATG